MLAKPTRVSSTSKHVASRAQVTRDADDGDRSCSDELLLEDDTSARERTNTRSGGASARRYGAAFDAKCTLRFHSGCDCPFVDMDIVAAVGL